MRFQNLYAVQNVKVKRLGRLWCGSEAIMICKNNICFLVFVVV